VDKRVLCPEYPDNSWKFVVVCSKAKAILVSFCCPKNKSPFSVGLKESPVTSAKNFIELGGIFKYKVHRPVNVVFFKHFVFQ
jgi:hypothetical protein